MGKKKSKSNKKNIKESVRLEDNNKESFLSYYFIIAGIIIFIFGLLYGFKILNPKYTNWIFAGNGDLMQHYVGWESFRAGDWTFPIGLTNVTSYPTNISVIYTDSIPILALFFKLISFMLPKTFQYLGIYGLICFILQGILSAHIVKRFTNSKWNIIVISILFTIIPSMIFRMYYHTALASQWLILLSLETLFLYDEFKEGNKIYYVWGIISFLVSTIHIYYLLMCGIILLGYIILDLLNTKRVIRNLLVLCIYLLVAFISIWILGGFTNIGPSDSFGYGLFSYNLNGLFNSQGWSVFLKELPMIEEQYEGFSYLGLGVILLMVIAFVLVIIWFVKDRDEIKKYKNLMISLLFISVVSVFVALSPRVYIGEHLLYELKLPEFINKMWAIFRSTGRFIWPVIHILTLLSVIIILKRLKWEYALFILFFCTCIQAIDIGDSLISINNFYRSKFDIKEEYDLYKNEYLKKVADNENIDLLVLVSGDFYDSDKMHYSDWAINNGIKTNRLHFARTSFDDILDKNTNRFLKKKSDSEAFVFTSYDECMENQLFCYELPNDYYLGYINELN